MASSIPTIVDAALVIPKGLLEERQALVGRDAAKADTSSIKVPIYAAAEAKKRIEFLVMQAVMEEQRSCGCKVEDVSKDNRSYDIISNHLVMRPTWNALH